MSFTNKNFQVLRGVKSAEYHAYGNAERGDHELVMSRSQLMDFAACPSRWLAGHEIVETPEMEYGSLIDCLVTSPESFGDRFAVYPEMYPAIVKKEEVQKAWNLNADFCLAWKRHAETGGRECVKPKHLEIARAAVRRLDSCRQIRTLLDESDRQVMMVAEWADEDTGIVLLVKILIDLLPKSSSRHNDSLADFKSCRDASHDAMSKASASKNYCEQAAMYIDVHNAATGEDRELWLLACQESTAPFEPVLWQMDELFVRMGRANYQQALRNYCQCLKHNEWPSYSKDARRIRGIGILEPLTYMLKDLQ